MSLALLLVLAGFAFAGEASELRQYESRHYEIHTNLTPDEVQPLAKHMDRVFANYQDRFEDFRSRRKGSMPLFLFRKRAQYVEFMRSHGINAKNSGGMFFVHPPDDRGLATWTQGRPRSETFNVLQHEGFHQFAFNHIGRELPQWINEGLAQYFQDAIIVGDRMKLGVTSGPRIQLVKQMIRERNIVPLEKLMSMTNKQWNRRLNQDAKRGRMMYAQAWSMCYFLIHGDDGRYQDAFETYLQLVSEGRDARAAAKKAFGVETLKPMGRRWARFAAKQRPDPITIAARRIRFLGEGMRFLKSRDKPVPGSLAALKHRLQQIGFRVRVGMHGQFTTIRADDEKQYRYRGVDGQQHKFKMASPRRNDLPPRLAAPKLRPRPVLRWSRNSEGKLVQSIIYR